MILYLGHSVDGVDYTAWTQKPRRVIHPVTHVRHWQTVGGCTVPGLQAHSVERFLGRVLVYNELIKLEVSVVRSNLTNPPIEPKRGE